MLAAGFFISPQDLWRQVGTADAPQIIDVRRRDDYAGSPCILPASVWREPGEISRWTGAIDATRAIVIVCKKGEQLSQLAAAELRAAGYRASVLEGGQAAWEAAKLPLVDKKTLDRLAPKRPSRWVTRRRPKIDRVACPWLIRRFIDPQAEILYVDPNQVKATAQESGAIPFDIEGIEISHDGPRCSFDTILKLFGIESEPSLAKLALIVRGADTARPDLAPEAAGLHAVSLGLSALAGDDDHGLLRHGLMVYDALFAWIRYASEERHNWPAKKA